MGLSPRVRGNPLRVCRPPPRPRSIPACAGEPTWAARMTMLTMVYPRVCGGTKNWELETNDHVGLSPRVRGNRLCHILRWRRLRSIPACAGEPQIFNWKERKKRVYPRVCGGTLETKECQMRPNGLSPRVRGNLWHFLSGRFAHGSIPACAGEPIGGYKTMSERTRSIPACAGEP